MTIKLSVDEALLKARSYVKKDKIAKAQKLYQIVLDDYSKQAKDIKKGIEPLKKSKQTIDKQKPSHEQLNNLLNYYTNGRLTEAERLATLITQEFPKNHFGWTMLGAVLTQLGRNSEAVKANQTAVALSPQDPESHYNLGNTLQKLGMLNEAEASYLNVISLKPNYAEVYNNYGNMLLKLGRLGDAEENFKQAIELKPEYTEAQYN